jgi:hypothetical protein
VQAVRLSDERVVISVLGRFLESVSQGGGLRSTANPAAGTLAGYLRAAHTLLESATGVTIPYVYSGAMAKGSGSSRIHSALADILAQQHAWCKPQQKKEPFTHDLLGSLHCHVDYLASLDPATSLDRTAAVFDWLALGLHTGSRLGEYGQSKPSKKHLFATVPAGPHTGEPLAFMRSDFVFWDAAMIQIPLSLAIARPSAVFEVHIRFRYDKSPRNYTFIKFRRDPSGSFLCPCLRVISILRRSDDLRVPTNYPVGVFRSSSEPHGLGYAFISGPHMCETLRAACIAAYPDPAHYLRQHIDRLVAHSTRVTAAVALRALGWDIPSIAVRLRWKTESVETYLRECYQDIGSMTVNAIQGSMVLTAAA